MRQGEIWVNKTLAGILTEDDNGYHFKYEKVYLENESTLAVSLTLPLQEEPFSAVYLFPFFDVGNGPNRSTYTLKNKTKDLVNEKVRTFL